MGYSEYLVSSLERVFTGLSGLLAIVSACIGAYTSFRLFRRQQFSKNANVDITADQISRFEHLSVAGVSQPFEIEALANYYNQALNRANVSFWFSIMFASIGFGVIIFAFLTHRQGDLAGTIVKVSSGAVIDAVSSLFFVQSTNAQKSMSDFFEKLRLDRLNAEAREMISEIENIERRDELRAQLILKYSGIDKLLTGN